MTLYDDEGKEVEAFTQKEVDAKVKEAGKESLTELKTVQEALDDKTTELEGLSKKYDDKKGSYKELQDKKKEDDAKYKEVLERDTNTYNEAIDKKISDIAGDDKEYAAELKKQLDDGVGSETTDSEAISKQLEKAQALTKIELSREVKSPVGGEGNAPASADSDDTPFTETTEGKDTFDALSDMMGLPTEEEAN